jgi:hypothetical protein
LKLAKLEQDAAMAALQARVRPTGAQDLGDQGAAALTHFVFSDAGTEPGEPEMYTNNGQKQTWIWIRRAARGRDAGAVGRTTEGISGRPSIMAC